MSKDEMAKLNGELKSNFIMTDLGEMKKILGIQVIWDHKSHTLKIVQSAYIDKILTRFNMAEANLVTMPLSKNIQLDNIDTQAEDLNMPYTKAIGSLMYVAFQTQPDIAFTVQHLSQYTSNPAQEHWTVVKQVLCYLKRTRDKRIVYKQAETAPRIEIYADAGFTN